MPGTISTNGASLNGAVANVKSATKSVKTSKYSEEDSYTNIAAAEKSKKIYGDFLNATKTYKSIINTDVDKFKEIGASFEKMDTNISRKIEIKGPRGNSPGMGGRPGIGSGSGGGSGGGGGSW